MPQFTTADPAGTEVTHGFPQFLPDGRHFLYGALDKTTGYQMYVDSLDSETGSTNRKPLANISGNIQYTRGGTSSSIVATP